MKEFFLDVHGNGCKDKGDMYSNWSHETCKTNPQRFIFTIKNKYYLVTYHQCLSINVIVANRVKKEFSKDPAKAVDQMIQKSLGILANI